jgi:hypothetical protein
MSERVGRAMRKALRELSYQAYKWTGQKVKLRTVEVYRANHALTAMRGHVNRMCAEAFETDRNGDA